MISFRKPNQEVVKLMVILLVLSILVLSIPTVAFAEDVEIKPLETGKIKDLGNNIYTIFAAIGSLVFLVFGMWHSFGVASSGKNANKRQQAMEAVGYLLVAVFIFYGIKGIAGVIRWLAESFGG